MINCPNCNIPTNNPKFCSRSCSTTFLNKGRRRSTRLSVAPTICLYCSKFKLVKSGLGKFCSNKHQQLYYQEKKVTEGTASAVVLRNFLLRTNGVCSSCLIDTWFGKPIILELDHIDGHWENNILSNVRLLCPNCHSQTSTYKNKNRGNGRPYSKYRA